MLLHEAVKASRKELGLSQKKLAELAGIQRRQLATLESGGNVTLATVRKVMTQLPNLKTFTLDTARVTHTPGPATALAEEVLIEALALYASIIARIAARIRAGIHPGADEVTALKRAHEMFEILVRVPEMAMEAEIRDELRAEQE